MLCKFVVVASIATLCRGKNLNGLYRVASVARQDVKFNSDYASKGHEYFDVYAPEIATHYGDAFWVSQGNLDLPKEIVERFAGKVMAITGYEQDQVMVTPTGKPGEHPENDVSVPINWAYNHHYMAWMTGAHSEMVEIEADPNDTSSHGAPMKNIAVDLPSAKWRADASIPTSQMFSEGNGGESRKSFHGYPKGYAQLVDSPRQWTLTPMQVDTRNRDCGVTPDSVGNCTKFTPGPEPRQARYGFGIPSEGTNYSGLLECPCKSLPVVISKLARDFSDKSHHAHLSRLELFPRTAGNGKFGGDESFYPNSGTKVLVHNYTAIALGPCDANQHVATAESCFEAVAGLMFNGTIANRTVTADDKAPRGCSVTREVNGTLTATFNGGTSNVECDSGSVLAGSSTTAVGVTFSLQLEEAKDVATITLSGPSDVWFGVGIDAKLMADQPYALIANESGVIEQHLGTCGSEADHCPGEQLESSIKLLSNSVKDGVRTLQMTRSLKGATSAHFTFDPKGRTTIDFISAVGSSQVFDYHKSHKISKISLVGTHGNSACICDIGVTGQMCETNATNCLAPFVKQCVAAPAGSLLEQRNPTCNSRQYAGGLRCCRHGKNLLDPDQEVPKELLRYHMKFRFWFEEYTPAANSSDGKPSHYDLPRIYYTTEANAGEYDIPPAFAKPGVPIPGYPGWPEDKPTPGTTCTGTCPNGDDCECIHTIEYHWSHPQDMRLVYAGGHCHAPSCVSIELFRNDTGELLCRQMPYYGNGDVAKDKFDEAGYVVLPPCLWGSEDEGLEPSRLIPKGTPLHSIKKNRNHDVGHYGEMASWQMRGVNF